MKICEIKNNMLSTITRSSDQVLVRKTLGIEETQQSPERDQDEIRVFGSDLALEPIQWRKRFHEVFAIGVRKSDYLPKLLD